MRQKFLQTFSRTQIFKSIFSLKNSAANRTFRSERAFVEKWKQKEATVEVLCRQAWPDLPKYFVSNPTREVKFCWKKAKMIKWGATKLPFSAFQCQFKVSDDDELVGRMVWWCRKRSGKVGKGEREEETAIQLREWGCGEERAQLVSGFNRERERERQKNRYVLVS